MNLSFYDQARMEYPPAIARPRDGAVAEWLVGAYADGGGCEEGGEFALQLLALDRGHAVRICAFTDGLGSLRALIGSRVLDAIESFGENVTAEHVADALIGAGLRDLSRVQLGSEATS